MCGICGIRALAPSFPADEELVTRMRETLVHRGPDAGGSWADREAGVALGHRRLSIIDLSDAGRQPMSNEDGTVWITYNGEVYNHAALRRELEAKGHVYRSRTDTETLVHLYEEEGPAFVERLEGMFALAVWDGRDHSLLLARDRLGVKPLYYAELPGGLLFASEVKALLAHPRLTPDLDTEAFAHFLTFAFAPTPRTLFASVRKLAPAERLILRADGNVRRETWWSPFSARTMGSVARLSEGEQVARVRDLLRDSIAKRMMSDVPFGVFLSGGLDSSTNVALMAGLSDRPVRTFSTAPRAHARYDELDYARLVAREFATDHHEVVIDEEDMLGFLPTLLFQQDEPLADWTAIPQHFVSALARESGTIVVQVGEGADEIFHGYRGYVDHRRYFVPFQRYVPGPLRPPIADAVGRVTARLGRGGRHAEALADAARSSSPYWGGSICFRGAGKERLLGAAAADGSLAIPERLWAEAGELWPAADVFQRMTYVELKQRLAELLLMRLDRVAMASSVEGREPFLDHDLVEFALALPPDMKHRGGEGKHVLRQAVRGLLPDDVLDRPKQGFGTPMPEWLRGTLGHRAQRLIHRSSLVERGAIEVAEVDRLFEAHRRGRGDWSYHLYNVFTVAAWHDVWVAGRRGEAEALLAG